METELIPQTLMSYLETTKNESSPEILLNPGTIIKKAFGDVNLNSPLAPVILVSDFAKKGFVYTNNGIRSLLGYSPRYLIDGGFESFFEKFNQADFKIVNENVFRQNFSVIRSVNTEQSLDFIFSHSYRIKIKDGKYRTMLQRFSFLLSADKKLIGTVGSITDISMVSNGNQMIHQIERASSAENTENEIIYKKYFFHNPEDSILSERETEILKWISEGLVSKEIADKLFLSVHTVINHRKSMLKKTNSKNSAELLKYAISNGLL